MHYRHGFLSVYWGTNGTQVIHRCKETAGLLALVIFVKGVNGFRTNDKCNASNVKGVKSRKDMEETACVLVTGSGGGGGGGGFFFRVFLGRGIFHYTNFK